MSHKGHTGRQPLAGSCHRHIENRNCWKCRRLDMVSAAATSFRKSIFVCRCEFPVYLRSTLIPEDRVQLWSSALLFCDHSRYASILMLLFARVPRYPVQLEVFQHVSRSDIVSCRVSCLTLTVPDTDTGAQQNQVYRQLLTRRVSSWRLSCQARNKFQLFYNRHRYSWAPLVITIIIRAPFRSVAG